jgi:hypothetical protein
MAGHRLPRRALAVMNASSLTLALTRVESTKPAIRRRRFLITRSLTTEIQEESRTTNGRHGFTTDCEAVILR